MTTNRSFSLVVAATQKGGIGRLGTLPWSLKDDMSFFKQLTKTAPTGKMNAVILGRKTWESIPTKFRPLNDRLNVILTRQPSLKESLEMNPLVKTADNLSSALSLCNNQTDLDQIFIIGGAEVYAEAIKLPQCGRIYQTLVLKDFSCDTFFPYIDPAVFKLQEVGEVKSQGDIPFQFNLYTRNDSDDKENSKNSDDSKPKRQKTENEGNALVNVEEQQYLALVRDVMSTGNVKGDRTNVGTISKFGSQMRFSLRERFPLLTTKRVFWKGVVEELLWLIKGCTDSRVLSEKKVKIWDGNGSREFLDKLGFTEREEGDLGPVYGHQWRHFGAKYVNCHTDYSGQGVDQLKQVIDTIKQNPNDRRILMSAWNVLDIRLMALPPCHVLCQFYVANGELSCHMYQRSCDLGLGVPFNIASYALLTCLIAQVCSLKPGDFVHSLGDYHVYLNHQEALKEQLTREPRTFPRLRLNPAVVDIDLFTSQDITLEEYQPHGPLKMEMAV